MNDIKNKTRLEHLIDLNDLPVSKWNEIINLAQDIYTKPHVYQGACDGKILATLFYEPSTRTQMSFQTAMIKLGGSIIGFDNPQNSSVSKGENLTDTTRIVSSYADIMVMRHPKEGAVKAAALFSECPVINAGDGGHLHPTQTLTDLVTLKLEVGRLDNLTIGLCGDLKNGRTVHSLVKALCMYPNNKFCLISTKELSLPTYIKDMLHSYNCEFTECDSIEKAIPNLDMLYMTRIQKERFSSVEEYNSQKDVFILDTKKLSLSKPTLKVMHPLPRVDEITMEVDNDPRAIYFKQASYGVFARMALILYLINSKNGYSIIRGEDTSFNCSNPNCITNTESYLKKYNVMKGDIAICEYCDTRKLL